MRGLCPRAGAQILRALGVIFLRVYIGDFAKCHNRRMNASKVLGFTGLVIVMTTITGMVSGAAR